MEQAMTAPISGSGTNLGTGGFMNPDLVVNEFGLKEGMRVADFGSGAGYFTILVAQRVGEGGRVYALDVMETALDSVRAKAKAAGLENVETIRANLEVLGGSGLADQSQDVVLLANILFQSERKTDIIREARRVLKEDGVLMVVEWKKGAGAVPNGRQGFGPPDSLRTDETAMKSMTSSEGFSFESDFNAGQFHYGMKFRKTDGYRQ